MPSTSYTNFTAASRAVHDRTNATGTDVDDVTAEDDRLIHEILSEGAVTTDAFKVQDGVGAMDVIVGSGSAKTDLYLITGEIAGQGKYLVRLDQTQPSITIAAADPSNARVDEIWLVMLDAVYDSNTLGTASAPLSLPKLAYRQGDVGGGNPGPDTLWKASALLARVAVGPAVTTITAGDITDQRATARMTAAAPSVSGHSTTAPDGSGFVTVTHGLGSTPTAVQITNGGTSTLGREFSITAKTSTTFTVLCLQDELGIDWQPAGQADFYWTAFV